MRVALFLPCYIDQLFPRIGFATIEVLERYGVEVEFPTAQTCCGQPLANTGCFDEARPLATRYFETFRDFEYVVCPSGSCTAMVRGHYEHFSHGNAEFESLCGRTYELCEFLVDVLEVDGVQGRFPWKVGLHQSCHGLRELRMGQPSESMGDNVNKVRRLLASLEGIEFVELTRPDECCGFGGTFAVAEEAVSCMMGLDRVHDHEQAGAEVVTAADMSCLMHLDGLIRRQGKPLRVMHVAEILAGDPVSETPPDR